MSVCVGLWTTAMVQIPSRHFWACGGPTDKFWYQNFGIPWRKVGTPWWKIGTPWRTISYPLRNNSYLWQNPSFWHKRHSIKIRCLWLSIWEEACISAIDKVPMGHLTVMQYNKMRFDHYGPCILFVMEFHNIVHATSHHCLVMMNFILIWEPYCHVILCCDKKLKLVKFKNYYSYGQLCYNYPTSLFKEFPNHFSTHNFAREFLVKSWSKDGHLIIHFLTKSRSWSPIVIS